MAEAVLGETIMDIEDELLNDEVLMKYDSLKNLCRDRLLPVLRDMDRRFAQRWGDWNWSQLANDLEALLK